ncbi:Arylsulfatase [Maioricimonas rarisocia]|uniref:Arylsulfatase n=1 Tax=Maioricimonas rarisocia TaxID=2528026 RepID=A0A517Z5Z3_9PLAN|nr:sulfatase [Maioricimonas rarisocia]QDU37851.1 Arylsulfatase [Maioricimonas rarisocia]
MRMLLTLFIALQAANAAVATQTDEACGRPDRPNIVLLFVDDLGWSDLGYRNPVLESPNIDRLAQEGLDFEQAYIPCPTCSPSRAALLTGKHPVRLQMVRHIPVGPKHADFDAFGRTESEFNLWKTDPARFPCRNWLPLEQTTYAEVLGELGYHNEFLGKWHLGHEPYHPVQQGFDRQTGTSNFGHPRSYYPPYFRNATVFADASRQYLTDRLTDEAVRFLKQYDRDQPFMLSLWYYNVHGPHQGREDLVTRFRQKGLTGKQAHYAAMVKSVDESVGRIRQVLAEQKLAENTVIVFLSDQGGYFENPPFRGGKRVDTLCEGGARVPFLVYWPGITEQGGKNRSIVQSTDLFPTLVEIAGGDPAAHDHLDGISLLPTIRGNTLLDRGRPIFGYRAYEDLYASVRSGKWKLLAYRSGKVALYDLSEDIAEAHDLSAEYPEKTSEMIDKLASWEREMGVAEYSGVQ